MYKISLRLEGSDYYSEDTISPMILDPVALYEMKDFKSYFIKEHLFSSSKTTEFLNQVGDNKDFTLLVENKDIRIPLLEEVIATEAKLEGVPFGMDQDFMKTVEYNIHVDPNGIWKCIFVNYIFYGRNEKGVSICHNSCNISNIHIMNGRFYPKFKDMTIVKNKTTGTSQKIISTPNYTGMYWNPFYQLKPIGTYYADEHDLG